MIKHIIQLYSALHLAIMTDMSYDLTLLPGDKQNNKDIINIDHDKLLFVIDLLRAERDELKSKNESLEKSESLLRKRNAELMSYAKELMEVIHSTSRSRVCW